MDVTQSKNVVNDGDIVAGDKFVNNFQRASKLSTLFDNLKIKFDSSHTVDHVSDNLKRYSIPRDVIGLEQKLINGEKQYLLEDAIWLKQEYFKKLTKFQFFEPAQEIHAFLLGVVLEKFRNNIFPLLLQESTTDIEISKAISTEIISPIVQIIQEHGCNDVMGLGATDIEGMIYFLTGQCHIKWTKS